MLPAATTWLQQWLLLADSWWAVPFAALATALIAKRQARFALFGVLNLVALTSGLLQLSAQQLEAPATGGYEFRVVSEPQRWGKSTRQFVELNGGPIGYLLDSELAQGAEYRARLKLEPLPTVERGAFRARSIGDITETLEADANSAFWTQLRNDFLANLQGLTPDSTALVAGLAIGERSLLSDSAERNMKLLSLTHLVAVSGANLAIVMGAIYLMARGLALPRMSRFALAALAAAGYIAIVGPEPSVLRASGMAYAVLIAAALGRAAAATQALSWSVILLVSFDPWLARDFAFALSVLATAGLLLVGPAIFEKLRPKLPAWLALGIAVTAAAQLYTLPVLLMLQPGLPTYSILANLIVEPVVAPVTILGISAAALATSIPAISRLFTFLASFGTAWIELVANELADWPGVRAAWPAGPAGIAAVAVLAILLTLWLRTNSKPSLIAATAVLALILGILLPAQLRLASWPGVDWDIAMCDVGQGDALVLRSSRGAILIDVGADEPRLTDCLNRLALDRIDLAVITHYDFDHAGAIGALRIPTRLALVSEFSDDRKLASKTLDHLKSLGAQIQAGTPAIAGTLGDASWRVLDVGSALARDANDASVVLLIETESYRLLALGDLSAEAQLRLLNRARSLLVPDGRPLVLKVSHHGSKDQAVQLHQWLKPQLALVSSGPNRFGHPHPDTLGMLEGVGAKVIRSDVHGHVALSFKNGLQLRTAGKVEP